MVQSGREGIFGRVRVGAVYDKKFREKFAILKKFFFEEMIFSQKSEGVLR